MLFSDYTPIANLDNLSSILDEQGVAVIPNVITADEYDQIKKKLWNNLCQKHDINSIDDYYHKINPIHGGLIHGYGVSLYPEIIDLKTDERIVEPFRRIWNEQELTMSLDGLYIGPPAEEKELFFDPQELIHPESFHTDQGSTKKGKHCIQSFVTLEDIDTGDGCLSVLNQSHKYHQEVFDNFGIHCPNYWFVLKQKHLNWFMNEKKCEWRMICAPKGSLIFWDSRTMHMATLPRKDRPNKNRWRYVVYVCYTPAKLQSERDSNLKRNAYLNNQMTSHWPYGVVVFGKRYNDLQKNDLNSLSEKQKKYIGI